MGELRVVAAGAAVDEASVRTRAHDPGSSTAAPAATTRKSIRKEGLGDRGTWGKWCYEELKRKENTEKRR